MTYMRLSTLLVSFGLIILFTASNTSCQDKVITDCSDLVTQIAEDNVIFVGDKPVMNYVQAVTTQFNVGADEVRIVARGRAISRAVDVAEVSRSRLLSDVEVKNIQISTETLKTDGGEINVSSIEITLVRSATDNVVSVGNKPVMNYVLAVATMFNSGADEVMIMARGRAISRAVDVAEVSRSRFLSDVEVKNIQISTETLKTDRGGTNVSSIEITLAK